MDWQIVFHPDFLEEFNKLSDETQDDILAKSLLLKQFGPHLGRPHADTLAGSRHKNMKELRLETDNAVWRVAFAFDIKRKGILLVAGNKKGKNQANFYKQLIKTADARMDKHLNDHKKR